MSAISFRPQCGNLVAPGRYGSNLKGVIYGHVLRIKFMSITFAIALR